MRSLFVCTLFVVAVFMGCSDDSNPASSQTDPDAKPRSESLIPLALGNEWYFVEINSEGEQSYDTIRVVAKNTATIDGTERVLYTMTEQNPAYLYQWYCDDWGLHLYDAGEVTSQYKYPIEPGETYEVQVDWRTITMVCLSNEETVTTEAGTFNDCYFFRATDILGNRWDYTFKPGYGFIRISVYSSVGWARAELQGLKINNPTAPVAVVTDKTEHQEQVKTTRDELQQQHFNSNSPWNFR